MFSRSEYWRIYCYLLVKGYCSTQRVVDKLIAWTIREYSIHDGTLGSKFDF